MGGGGVQRWLKFTKYLRNFNWEPIIYTPSNADVANYDESLLKEVPDKIEVHKTSIWEPFDLYKKFTGKGKDEKVQPGFLQESDARPLMQKISVWIRGNLFIPDAKKFWIRPSVKYLTDLIKKENIGVIISTGPPHSTHIIALKVKEKTGVKWMADFRDPWTNIDYYDKLMLTQHADNRHRILEKKVLTVADVVVTVSRSWARDFELSAGILPEVITNGFDPEDFEIEKTIRNDVLTITHIGSLNKDRNPHAFWKALKKINDHYSLAEKVRIRLIGPTDVSVFSEVDKFELSKLIFHQQNIPHGSVIQEIRNSDLLLLPLNDTPNIDGVIPGKLYEYLASKRPIICIGKKSGDSAEIIAESNSGHTFEFNDVEGIVSCLEKYLQIFQHGEIPDNSNVPLKFSRNELAGKIGELLNRITNQS